MNAKLICKSEVRGQSEFILSKRMEIGKSKRNDIVLSQSLVSSSHAVIQYDEARTCFFIEDLKSSNGTWVDGKRIKSREQLYDTHVINLATEVEFLFVPLPDNFVALPETQNTTLQSNNFEGSNSHTIFELRASAENDDKTTTINTAWENSNMPFNDKTKFEAAPQKSVDGLTRHEGNWMIPVEAETEPATDTTQQPQLLATKIDLTGGINSNPSEKKESVQKTRPKKTQKIAKKRSLSQLTIYLRNSGKKYRLAKGRNIVGRGSACDIRIQDDTISKQHACITVFGENVSVQDLNSKNRTYVKHKAVTSEVRIRPSSKIKFGKIEAFVERIT